MRSTSAVADSAARAVAVRAFLRSRRRRFRPSAYQVYATIVVGSTVGALGHGVIGTLVGGGLSIGGLGLFGPAVLLLILLAAARFGTWQGPVSFSAPDVALLLMAPIACEELVRPKLDRSMLTGATLGAVIGVLVILVIAGGPGAFGLARAVATVIAISSLSLLATALSWLVQSSRRLPAPVRRASPSIAALAIGVVVLEALVGHGAGVWSGPWGWALAPAVNQSGWPLATAGLMVATAGLAVYARHRAGASTVESFLMRSSTRSALTAGVVGLNYRGALLTYRAAQPQAISRTIAVPRPKRAACAILWRDAVAMTRNPSRVAWAAAFTVAATLEAVTHPGRLLPAGLAAGAIYFASTLMIEPLRVDVDYPERSAILLSWPFAYVLRAHCVLPIVMLVLTTAATLVAAVIFGVASPAVLLVMPTLLLPLVGITVFATARAARRGGRIGEELHTQLMTTDPMSPSSIVIIPLLVAPWLIATVITVGGVIALIGR